MRYAGLLALVLLVFVAPAYAAGPEQLTYLTEEYPPANYMENGTLKGYAVDVLKAMWKKMGVPEQPIEVINWARAYRRAETTPNTMVFTMTRNAERENLFQWVGPIYKSRYVLVGRAGRTFQLGSPSDAGRYRVGVIRDDVGHKLIREAGIPDDKLEKVGDFRQLLKMLDADRVDLLCVSDTLIPTVSQWSKLKSGDLTETLVISEVSIHYAISKGTDPTLVKRFQSALDAIEPERRRILKTYQEASRESP